ncbi:DUF551 domain-containing protein [Klebsiella pneumoniae]|uniref:DUF551 domain-containing protein n=1 Tax=Klebsiella pneumoniae TaxID=573 RepID=UPI003CF4D70C
MTKSTITRERLQEIAEDGFLKHGESKELARMALAAMDSEPVAFTEKHEISNMHATGLYLRAWPAGRAQNAVEGYTIPLYTTPQPISLVNSEPVAYIFKHPAGRLFWALTDESNKGQNDVMPVYASPQPAPVVPEEKPIPNTLSMYAVDAVAAIAEVKGWNACRAAMLERQLVDRVDEKSLTSINPAPAMGSLSKTGEVLHTNSPAQGGNSSVIPDTWIPVSEQMPPSRHEVLVGRWWGEKPRWCCKWATYIPGHPDAQSSGWLIPGGSWTPTHWMELPAAPQGVIHG